MTLCDTCARLEYDEELDEYYCTADFDQDDIYRMRQSKNENCPFYRNGDDYMLVRKQN